MFKIPGDTKQISQTNESDFSGNIWYSKNISFREKGYIKLPARSASIFNEETDVSSQFMLPIDFFGSQDLYTMATAKKPMNVNISETTFSVDTTVYGGSPTLNYNSRGLTWNGRFYVTTDTGIYYSTGNNTWTSTGITLTTGKIHSIELFKTLGWMCVSDGSTVYLYDSSYVLQTSISVPTNYTITAIKYSNGKLGIATESTDEAVFFVSDASSDTYDSAVPVGSDMILGIVSYKNTWVLLNRRGQLLYFNGGGFNTIATLPYYYRNYLLGSYGSIEMSGNCLYVEGDFIYINIPTELDVFGENAETYLENLPGGILCYDPKVGLYHIYSPSFSPIQQLLSISVDTATDTITTSFINAPTGTPIKYVYNGSPQLVGANVGTVYYLIRVTDTTFKLALTKDDAIAGIAIDITSAGTFNNFLSLNVLDYGAVYNQNIQGGIVMPSSHTQTHNHLMFGSQLTDSNSDVPYGNLELTIDGFKNIGYIVTPKLYSQNILDNFQQLNLKFRPLHDMDTIIVKYKDKELLGLPITTTPGQNNCSWTNDTTITTTKNLSQVLEYFTQGIEMEVEIIAGVGAGQLSQLTNITENAGTYTITLEDSIDGAASGYFCDIIINNWKYVDAATVSDNDNYKEMSVAVTSTWTKYKVIMNGVGIAIEEMQFINVTDTPSK